MFTEDNILCPAQAKEATPFVETNFTGLGRFRPPLKSRATRKINFRSRVSGRASLVRLRRYDNRLVQLVAESVGEIRCVNLLMARRDVVDIWDQPEPVKFMRSNGKVGTHTFDYLVKFTSGRRVAIAVKPAERASKTGFAFELARIAEAMPSSFADTVLLHTERDFSLSVATNAARMCEFVKQPDPMADRALLSVAHKTNGRIRLSDLVKLTGLGPRVYRSAHRSIYDGNLTPCSQGLITPDIWIEGGKT